MNTCTIDGCGSVVVARGLCNKHLMRLRVTGTTDPGPKAHAPIEERFWRRVDKRGPDECWNVQGDYKKYAGIQIGGKGSASIGMHVLSYKMHKGSIPPGWVVMHSCDNPRCVNPAHLSTGTYQQNMHDMIAKGRRVEASPRGEGNGKAKLTEELVRYIRANPQRGHKDLADELGLSPNAVRGVRIGRTWKHVT